MSLLSSIAALVLAVQAAPAPPPPVTKPPSLDERMTPQLQAAAQAVRMHQPQAALDILAPVLAAYEADHAQETRRIYCGMSLQETLLYGMMAAKDKVGAVMLPPGYCTALYLKGYALVDLGRIAEAKPIYERLLTLAPMYAQYQTEYGQLLRLEKDWPRMLAICTKASEAAAIADPAIKPMQQGAALRCQGYALTELHRYAEAEQRYRDALAINPNDAKAQNELGYIAQQRAKAPASTPTS
ncbi:MULTISPECIES: tetratricopeptide repeat protein [Sphingomonas]|uniref:Tetratricopeptide repeat protein n=1 Tax=Sphingomonas paucimobilis TaxID=13689 RepID=A0A7Y2PBB2_SPHPI|nr:tetratricopeptide repeat protein [Sphingomonas paucimobilis]MCM3681436.1 tetratricopeptide repeat protein [Sphingomonas paucimobilis]NNG56511.1 tetratricopeptide repeat protein [Sphingomonas paucimobilis]